MEKFLKNRIGKFSIYGGLIMAILITIHFYKAPRSDTLYLDFLAIGQGDSILITVPSSDSDPNGSYRILVDGGPDQNVLSELDEILPFMDRTIDLVILTHPHADHVDGLVQVLRRYQVRAVLMTGVTYNDSSYDAFLKEIQDQNIPFYIATASQDFQFGPAKFDLLFPFTSLAGTSMGNINNSSIVFRLEACGHTALFQGDAEKEVEESLLDHKIDVSAELIKAGHHGSRTASSLDFLEAVAPDLMVIQFDVDNSFGHPHSETLETLEELDIEMQSTEKERVRIEWKCEGK